MQYFLNLLPVLACPLMMGAMIWLMMRGSREQTPSNERYTPPSNERLEGMVLTGLAPDLPPSEPTVSASPSLFKAIGDCVQMCLNWKVLVGLATVAGVIWFVAPQFALVALPVLLVLVCPASMIFMMARMRRGGPPSDAPGCQACESQPTREEQLASLKNQHEALEAPIAELEQSEVPSMALIEARRHRESNGRF